MTGKEPKSDQTSKNNDFFSIENFDIIESLEKIVHNNFLDGTFDLLTRLRDRLQLSVVSLISFVDYSKKYRYISSTRKELTDLSETIGNLQNLSPYLTGLFFENKGFEFSSPDELPQNAITDLQFLESRNIRAAVLIPVYSYYRNNYAILGISSEERIWKEDEKKWLGHCGTLLVSSIERVDLREEIGESERKFRIVAEYSPDMARWVLPDLSVAYNSPNSLELTGYPPEEFIQDRDLLQSLVHPHDIENFKKVAENLYLTKSEFKNRFRIITRSGEIKWIESIGCSVQSKEGEFLGYRTNSRDITDWVDLEEKLRMSEEKYRMLVESLDELIYETLPDGTLILVNDAFLKFFNLNENEIIGKNIKEVIPAGGWEEINLKIGNLDQENPVISSESRLRKADGSVEWLNWIIKGGFDQEGKLVLVTGAARIVTRQKELENQLIISEELYRTIVNAQNDPICRYRTDGTLTYMNTEYSEMFGISPEEVPGINIFSFINPEEAGSVRKMINSITPQNPVFKSENIVIYKDGSTGWQSWVNTGIFNGSNELVEIEGVGRDINELKETLKKFEAAVEEINLLKQQLEVENVYLKERISNSLPSSGIVTRNPAMLKILANIRQVAKVDTPVLITGETGTGKELIAKAIHEESDRKGRMMVTVNCAAIPSSLIESELFGREKGAYTGALTRQIGRFELADKSTIFLDEISELPLETQSKLLRIIQFGEFQMLGSPVTRKVNVRIIAATNRNLIKAIEEGTFRSDLYYRLNVFPIAVPSLRDRREDIPILVWNFVEEFSNKMGKRIKSISQKSLDRVMSYSWPGNVRELRNIVEFSMILTSTDLLSIHLHEGSGASEQKAETMHDSERNHIVKILTQTGWRIRGKGGAAEILAMNESTLRFRMKKLGIMRGKKY